MWGTKREALRLKCPGVVLLAHVNIYLNKQSTSYSLLSILLPQLIHNDSRQCPRSHSLNTASISSEHKFYSDSLCKKRVEEHFLLEVQPRDDGERLDERENGSAGV